MRFALCAFAITMAVALLAAACSGNSVKPRPATHLAVTYAVGWGNRPGRCPTEADCTYTATRLNPNLSIHIARFTLRCDPAKGSYPNPRRACSAVADYIRLVRHPRPNPCACPGVPYVDIDHITGLFHGRPVHLALSPCETCALGARASADLMTITPRT
jgi:hypothetical protein